MISYAQNFEDVILERIFKNQESGFYVDIGACHPVYDSVTYHFYLKGWSGINVEPQPKLFSELVAGRERDTNLRMCVGAQAGSETLYITHDVGTSTLSRSIAENYRRDLSIDEELTVELITLDQIWSQHVGDRQVDFMKIDVEGFERDVLSGADFSTVAPSVLVIEATIPNSRELCYDHWEALILEYYEFFYFDGLNRFYARKGYPLDKASFSTPPNVFDQFKVLPQVLVEQANESLSIENQALKQQLQMSLAQLSRKDEALYDAGNAYADLKVAFDDCALHASELFQSSTRSLEEASTAYESLKIQFEEKLSELARTQHLLSQMESAVHEPVGACAELHQTLANVQAQLQESYDRQKQSDQALSEATVYCESLAAQLQRKDDALADAAQAYQALKEELDEKIWELGELHLRLFKQTQPKVQ